MSAGPEKKALPDAERLETAVDLAVAACGGDARAAIRALLVANEFYETEYSKLVAQVSRGYARGEAKLPRDRKNWFD
jgi:hypothetical protein